MAYLCGGTPVRQLCPRRLLPFLPPGVQLNGAWCSSRSRAVAVEHSVEQALAERACCVAQKKLCGEPDCPRCSARNPEEQCIGKHFHPSCLVTSRPCFVDMLCHRIIASIRLVVYQHGSLPCQPMSSGLSGHPVRRRKVRVHALRQRHRPLLPRLPVGALRAGPAGSARGHDGGPLAVPALLRG